MKVIIQRVLSAQVKVDEKIVGKCDKGFCVLIGIEANDTSIDLEWMTQKIIHLRVFSDEQGKMNKSIVDINGSMLLVSQFTLLANCQMGRRPSFTKAGDPLQASKLFNLFVETIKKYKIPTETGIFGAEMLVQIENDGPATFILESPTYDNRTTKE